MALTYTFHLPGNCALSTVKVYNAAGTLSSTGTTDSNATYSVSLAPNDYTAKVEKGRIFYTAAGEAQRPGGADADSDSAVTSVASLTGAVTAQQIADAVNYTTGWLDLSAVISTASELDPPLPARTVMVIRRNDDVTLSIDPDQTYAVTDWGVLANYQLQLGLRPDPDGGQIIGQVLTDDGTLAPIKIATDGTVTLATVLFTASGCVEFKTADAKPGTLTGDPI